MMSLYKNNDWHNKERNETFVKKEYKNHTYQDNNEKEETDKKNKELVDNIINYITSSEKDPDKVYKLFSTNNGYTQQIAMSMNNSQTTQNQIRKFYDYAIKIDSVDEKKAKIKLAMMMPQIYYAVQRKAIDSKSPFVTFLDRSIDCLNNTKNLNFKEAFNKFLDVFEAIVAYSKKN